MIPDQSEDQLVRDNLKLVSFVIAKYYPQLVWDDDAFQWGCIGLLNAIRTFDPARAQFSTYAAMCIRFNVSRGVYRHDNAKCRQNNGIVSLDELINANTENKPLTVMGSIAAPDMFGLSDIKEIIQRVKSKLNERDGIVLDLTIQGYTQREIAKRLGVGQVTVSRAESRVKSKILEAIAR